MELEKKRGISITSSVLQFEYEGYCINILDTPGHQDFSEDTYRTLTAADSVVMVIDAAKGIEPQTRKLFKVCAMRHIPIFTFINKMDREARDPFELLDELEKEFGIGTYPMNWPIGCGVNFKGVYDRGEHHILTFSEFHGGRNRLEAIECDITDTARLDELIGEYSRAELVDQIELLDGASFDFDLEKVRSGKLTPVFSVLLSIISASSRFREFFKAHNRTAAAPLGRQHGRPVRPTLFGVCFQDTGKHEQGTPRPYSFYAYLLRQIRTAEGIYACSGRQTDKAVAPTADDGAGARGH